MSEEEELNLLEDVTKDLTLEEVHWMTAFCHFPREVSAQVEDGRTLVENVKSSYGHKKLLENMEILLSSVEEKASAARLTEFRRKHRNVSDQPRFMTTFRMRGNLMNFLDRREHLERALRFMFCLHEDDFLWEQIEYGSLLLRYSIPMSSLSTFRQIVDNNKLMNVHGVFITEIRIRLKDSEKVVYPQKVSGWLHVRPIDLYYSKTVNLHETLLYRYLSLTGRDVHLIDSSNMLSTVSVEELTRVRINCHTESAKCIPVQGDTVVHVVFDKEMEEKLNDHSLVFLLPKNADAFLDTVVRLSQRSLSFKAVRDISGTQTPITEIDIATGEIDEVDHFQLLMQAINQSERRPPDVRRTALLIGPTYPFLPVNKQLPGVENDINTIREIIQQPPFNFRKIHILEKHAATKENILQSMHDIVQNIQPRSVFFLFYAGHGMQVEGEWDEGLVTADVPTVDGLQNSPEKFVITGDDLRPFLNALSERNVYVFMVFDCCHSGRIYRGFDHGDSPFQPVGERQITFDDLMAAAKANANPDAEEDTAPKYRGNDAPVKRISPKGWSPSKASHFVHLAAASHLEVAYEVKDRADGLNHGLLTSCMRRVIKEVKRPEELTMKTLYRLVLRELERTNRANQTPQLEGAGNMTLFGKTHVDQSPTQCYEVMSVIDDRVTIGAGQLQLLHSGQYDIFAPTTNLDVATKLEKESPLWCGRVDISDYDIDLDTTRGYVIERSEHKPIERSCLCVLHKGSHPRYHVTIRAGDDESKDIKTHLEAQKLFKMRPYEDKKETKTNKFADLIVITKEDYKGSPHWFTRRSGKSLIPPVSADETTSGTVLAVNLAKVCRYEMALKQHHSNGGMMLNVRFHCKRISSVTPYRAADKTAKIQRALTEEPELYQGVCAEPPRLKAHKVAYDAKGNVKEVTPGSGDAIVFQVENHEDFPIHVCVLLFGVDGSISDPFLPNREGRTIEIGPGKTDEEIFRLYIPEGALRNFVAPDPDQEEPQCGRDVLLLFATRKQADYSPLLQEGVTLDYEKCRGSDPVRGSLNPLESFENALLSRNNLDSAMGEEGGVWLVERRDFLLETPST
ncbi:uncharacterized protein LOC106155116 isoform X1 [Lingula anatina]|uniref:Uncharacterized protein LOC106155116 isoform X1 n=1 Tax=Lingula anatina TaxID=7574 RepID=A0A1S3HGM7_LINAN|nr:uncharacterized protein LOC106155116 isoform X1 [Lingula anatina]XP_013385236.1 uncharacterized protein LOC106155116 isoform X1 [Lingula anatina]XP_013385237.1 uncharacterized protein LOC106155116 isoform X1 [Lingula anatina]XP_013385238.1 uncharacterized protein LOC106155116 isoform X1 [Lingula anatina]XP_013385239.1 uncharacterized protein LOC106155116 isoform X1 [Lingula anatina]|eukprot:XP_013385235.1 uncharacterized protein LOC106155116 isoform X1 [Lingula anatina]